MENLKIYYVTLRGIDTDNIKVELPENITENEILDATIENYVLNKTEESTNLILKLKK